MLLLKCSDLKNEPEIISYCIPSTTSRRELTRHAIEKSKSYYVLHSKFKYFIFSTRLFYLTPAYKREWNYPSTAKYEMGDIYIIENYRRKGLAFKFLKKIIQDTQGEIVLWTTKDNIPAINLYKKLGFKQLKTSPTVYRIFKMKQKEIISFSLS